jgi:hypothetical protein
VLFGFLHKKLHMGRAVHFDMLLRAKHSIKLSLIAAAMCTTTGPMLDDSQQQSGPLHKTPQEYTPNTP